MTSRLVNLGSFELEYESPRGRRLRVVIPGALIAWTLAAFVAIAGLTVTLPAYAAPPDDTPAADRPDDRGDEQGQGLGQGSSRGGVLGQGRGNGTTTTTSSASPLPVEPPSSSTVPPITLPLPIFPIEPPAVWPPTLGDPLPPTRTVPVAPLPIVPRQVLVCVT